MDNVREEFIKDREERYNGKLSFISFAKYIGRSDENVIYNLSGLVYVINRVLYRIKAV